MTAQFLSAAIKVHPKKMSKSSDAVYRTIRESILSGEFAPGARLKEAELVELCGCSRTPVREALRILAAEDYLTIIPNQGAEVKTWSSDEIDDLFQLRALLEGHAAAQAASRISLSQLETIQKANTLMSEILIQPALLDANIEEFLRLNQIIHNTIWEAAGSERLILMLTRLIEQAVVVKTARQFSRVRLSQSHHHHIEIYAALKSGSPSWAEAITRSHIYAAKEALSTIATVKNRDDSLR